MKTSFSKQTFLKFWATPGALASVIKKISLKKFSNQCLLSIIYFLNYDFKEKKILFTYFKILIYTEKIKKE